MDLQTVADQLRAELNRIDRAIAVLTGLGSQAPRRGRPPKTISTGKKRHSMSASARARISATQKARWAKQKRTAIPKKAVSKRKPMSPALRKKLSAMMKARWAARKKSA